MRKEILPWVMLLRAFGFLALNTYKIIGFAIFVFALSIHRVEEVIAKTRRAA